MTPAASCAKCGRVINGAGTVWGPSANGELCSWCLTGHGPGWLDYPEPDWWLGRWLMRSRLTRWMFAERDE